MRGAAAGARERSERHVRTVGLRLLNYATNKIVSSVPSFVLRHAWYRRLGLTLGAGSGIYSGCYIWYFGPRNLRATGASIGANTRINRGCCLDLRGPLSIGDNVSISPDVAIITTQHDFADPAFSLQSRGVLIEDHVWIGIRATILPGSTIGRGAVVAAGAVVSGRVAPMSVVAGVPARPIAVRPESALGYELTGPLPLFE